MIIHLGEEIRHPNPLKQLTRHRFYINPRPYSASSIRGARFDSVILDEVAPTSSATSYDDTTMSVDWANINNTRWEPTATEASVPHHATSIERGYINYTTNDRGEYSLNFDRISTEERDRLWNYTYSHRG